MSEKTHWPTPRRLSNLRDEGRFPYSPLASRFLVLAMLLIVFLSARGAWSSLWSAYRKMFTAGLQAGTPAGSAAWYDFASQAANLFLVVGFACAICALLIILISSKFLFRMSLISLDPARFNPFLRPSDGITKPFFWAIARCFAAFGAGALIFRAYAQEVLALLNKKMAYFIGWPAEFAQKQSALWLLFLVIAAVICWLCAWLGFMLRNKMTALEVRNEGQD